MNSRSLSNIAIAGCLVFGAVLWGLRYRSIQRDEIAREETHWELTYDVQFKPEVSQGQQEATVSLAIPFDTPHCQIVDDRERWIVTNPKVDAYVSTSKTTGNRMLNFKTRQTVAEPDKASASFVLKISPRATRRYEPVLETLTPDATATFTQHELSAPKDDPVVREKAQLIPDAEGETDSERLQWIFEYCSDIDSSDDTSSDDVKDVPPDDVKAALSSGRGTPKARARTMVTLCRAIRIPARLVAGFRIRQDANVEPHVWVEVFQTQAWVPFDPTDGWSLNLPMEYVPVRRGSDEVYTATNVTGFVPKYSIKRLKPDSRILKGNERRLSQIFDLTRLPVPQHKVMKILLLLPFAALITALLRNVVGLGTFGTFSPALLAMSFIYADLRIGLAILLIVVVVGLVGRNMLERLRLLTVPRLSIILTLVILCVVFGVSVLQYLVDDMSIEVVLVPMVILTMLIERFHVSAEEDGLVFTVKLALGTLLVAVLCYLMLGWETIGNWILTYPEAHLFTIAAFIGLGRYAGYRLTELWRFRDLIEPTEASR
jgi:transglutaminase-like putative cysteine protease